MPKLLWSMWHYCLLFLLSMLVKAHLSGRYKQMVMKFYQSGTAWLSGTLYRHFVDLYGASKLGIQTLFVLD